MVNDFVIVASQWMLIIDYRSERWGSNGGSSLWKAFLLGHGFSFTTSTAVSLCRNTFCVSRKPFNFHEISICISKWQGLISTQHSATFLLIRVKTIYIFEAAIDFYRSFRLLNNTSHGWWIPWPFNFNNFNSIHIIPY